MSELSNNTRGDNVKVELTKFLENMNTLINKVLGKYEHILFAQECMYN